MARVTVEDCLERVPNRFDLVVLAARRARDLTVGKAPLVQPENDKPAVIALREIAEGKIDLSYMHTPEEKPAHALDQGTGAGERRSGPVGRAFAAFNEDAEEDDDEAWLRRGQESAPPADAVTGPAPSLDEYEGPEPDDFAGQDLEEAPASEDSDEDS